MRQAHQKQLHLIPQWLPLEHAQELRIMGEILDQNRAPAELVWEDLKNRSELKAKSAEGLSAEQILRALILKQHNGFSYRELAFHLADSMSYRTFCGLG